MSDTWYRDPPDLPPFEDGFGRRWTFDGRCLNPDYPFAVLVEGWQGFVADAVTEPPPPITWPDVEAMWVRLMAEPRAR